MRDSLTGEDSKTDTSSLDPQPHCIEEEDIMNEKLSIYGFHFFDDEDGYDSTVVYKMVTCDMCGPLYYIETALQRLSDMLNESSLTRLFKSLYDKTIVDVRVRMEGIHKQVEEDHESFVRDYTLMTSDYNAVQRHIKWQREQIQLLQEQITDLKSALEETNNQLNLIRHRVRIDGTDRIDYAYEKNGGRVLTGRKWTTEPPSGAYFAWSIQQADPSLAINPPTEKGYCYPMDSSKAMFTVRVLQPRNPEYFSIDHISQYVTEDRRTAPKLMEIWVMKKEELN
ncbi:hypothetical protein JH06_1512 [Blastocystis sp. subtype 4]|uniref:hypothetical protein n=1 Tax=Blastocystis sp. subtype 4 TaxID=944170 RepID=UPI000711A66E|nr:hypothetical protein JH06_1512 [Blastocystis sp. subtype 4]KNB44816.1 hypothetical protein JH06_1512 [Blastocystis sp. subtype 4]|eukprot:XP_014528259.1 hypothetical protein JH06_1512 [Blastocystis sp. subtype 4]